MATNEKKVSRRVLSLKEKFEILKAVDSGRQKKDVASDFNIPRSTLSTILKQRGKLDAELPTSRKRIRGGAYEDVETALLEWIKSARSQNIPISGPLLKQKARDFAFLFDEKEFTASDGWMSRFKTRHDLVWKSVSGESAAVDMQIVSTWRENFIPEILKEYQPKNVFNADESGLFYKMLPDKTLTFKNDSCHGGKHSKERLTVMFAANMDGSEKEKLLVLGKSKKPRCFKGVHHLPVDYDGNKKAWMTTDVFVQWIKKFDRRMATQNRKVLLLLDNCASHKVPDLVAVTVKFFPANCTSVLQPMDQGIIKNVKGFYRKRLVQRTLINVELRRDTTITLTDAIGMLYGSWNEVKAETIAACFRHAGFNNRPKPYEAPHLESEAVDSGDNAGWELISAQLNLENVTFQDYVDVDKDIQISHELTDNDADIVDEIKSKKKNTAESDEDSDDDNVAIPKIKTSSEALLCLEDLRLHLQFLKNVPGEILENLESVEKFLTTCAIQHLSQKKITTFFKPNS